MPTRLRQALPVMAGLILFAAALEVLRLELSSVTWPEISADVLAMAPARLLVALLLTVVNYAALSGYDLLAFAYVGQPMPARRVALASFLAYAVSNNVGFAMLSGASIRYRFYSRWGVTAEQLSRIVLSYSITFWLGLLGLGGLSLVLSPVTELGGVATRQVLVPLGWILMLAPVAFLVLAAWRTQPLVVAGHAIAVPSLRIAVGQVSVSSLDWALAGAVLYAVLPAPAPPFLAFLGCFLIATLLGMVSHVPGGVGVFEGLMVLLLKPYLDAADLLPALVVYRVVYYLVPLAAALAVLVADELWRRRHQLARARGAAGRLAEQTTPRVLAVVTFAAGLVLLFSGATPAADGRLAWLARLLPIGVIEASHFLASIAGAALLILSQGVARRLDAAFYLTATALVGGMVTTLLKGGDYEEALLVLAALAALWRARHAFDRRAAFFDTRFPRAWLTAVAAAVLASVWLGFFAFKHVDYANDLWWQFELQGEASRFLRASVGVAILCALVALARLVGYAPHEVAAPTEADLADAGRVIAAQSSTFPFLAYLGDKGLLFNDDRSAFVMYGVQGRTWVALGDPVGPDALLPDLVRRFLERCADFGGTPVFYEVGRTHMHSYADAGLTFVKLGEEARVPLASFTLDGGGAARFRQAVRRLDKDGATFRVVAASEVPALLDELRAVSDEWLADKDAAEKGFSLGYFDAAYLSRFPVAIIEHHGRIDAFANLWCGADRRELSIDLMRYRRDAPKGVMEGLFVHLMLWGRDQGYAWFALGMAPLSGVAASPLGSPWQRLGAFLYEHGEAIYHFQGLRAYKDKFNPVWEPHYLAYPGGLTLARILADVSALVAGGYRRIFTR